MALLGSGLMAMAAFSYAFDVEASYRSTCFACHASGAVGAPKTGDKEAWASRIEEKGMDTLVNNAKNGVGAMPPGGLCQNCTDEQFKALIEYMAK